MISNLTTKTIDTIYLPACEACGMTTMQPMHVRPTSACTTPIYGYDHSAFTPVTILQHDTTHTYDTTCVTCTHNTYTAMKSAPIRASHTTATILYTSSYATMTPSAQNYYGYRYYSTNLGRWISRDPIFEMGHYLVKQSTQLSGVTLTLLAQNLNSDFAQSYVFLLNDILNDFDILGEAGNDVPPCLSCELPKPPSPPLTPPAGSCGPCSSGDRYGKRSPAGYEPDNNGCGPKDGIKVPDDPTGKCSFRSACINHDICYGTCNNTTLSDSQSRKNCDKQWEKDMRSACFSCFGNPRRRSPDLIKCLDWADTYHLWVRKYGKSPYKKGQKEGCEKCCCPNS